MDVPVSWHRADRVVTREAVKLHDFRNRRRDSARFSVSERNGVDAEGACTLEKP